jgi:hypothetical protein
MRFAKSKWARIHRFESLLIWGGKGQSSRLLIGMLCNWAEIIGCVSSARCATSVAVQTDVDAVQFVGYIRQHGGHLGA